VSATRRSGKAAGKRPPRRGAPAPTRAASAARTEDASGLVASRWFAPLLFLVVGGIVYGRALGNGFVLDDESQILGNPSIHSLASIGSYFGGSTMDTGGAGLGGVYYKPLLTLAYAVLWSLFGASGLAFHGFQLLVHVLVACLAMSVFRLFFSARVSLVLALLFLVHPINTECVVYAADLQDALYMLFGLLALRLTAREGRFGPAQGLAVAACLLLAMLSKETGVLFVLLGGAYLFWFKRERLPTFAAAAAASGVAYAVLRFSVANLYAVKALTASIVRAPLGVRLLTMPKVITHYLLTFLYPARLTVTEDWVVTGPGLLDFWLPLGALVAISGALVWYLRSRRDPQPRFFALWLGLGLALHSQLLPLDGTVADRWFYFPELGALGLLAIVVRDLVRHLAGRFVPRSEDAPAPERWWWVPLALLTVLYGGRAMVRSLDWRAPLTFYAHELRLQPESFVLLNDYGVELVRDRRVAESEPYLRHSTEVAPSWNINWSNLGLVQASLGQWGEAEASFKRSMANGPYSLAYEGYARLLTQSGRLDEARRFLHDEALPQFPESPALADLYAAVGQNGR
jgi:hypothetical protein